MSQANHLGRNQKAEPTPEERIQRRKEKHDEATAQRIQLEERLRDEGADKLADKLATCGLDVPLTCVNCGSNSTVQSSCKQRWCPVCAWRIQQERVSKYKAAITAMKWPMMLTLTQPNSADPESVIELRKSWAKMRRRTLIQRQIAGGVAAIEVTNNGKGWHPHLHAIVDCHWLALHTPAPQRGDDAETIREKCNGARLELSALWAAVIKHPHAIVLAARIKDPAAAAYALKYCTKAAELLECKERIAPLIRVLAKTRLVSAFGNLHGRMAELETDDFPGCECPECQAVASKVPSSIITYLCRSREATPGPSMIYEKP